MLKFTSKFFKNAAILVIATLFLSACGSNGGGFKIFGGGYDGIKVGAKDEPRQQLPIGSVCPKVEIRPGTETLRLYERNKRENQFLQVQAHIEDMSRECRTVGNQTLIDVKIAGRIVKGPKANSGNYQAQIRFVVIDKDANPITGAKHDFQLALNPASPVSSFITSPSTPVTIDEIDPVTLSGYTVYIGFDDKGKR